MIVSRRGAFGRVPGAAIFRAVREQPGEYEEGKYNMNLLSHLNTILYCILILYAYKDFPSHLITLLYISFGLHFG
jgi:hypothetical protein